MARRTAGEQVTGSVFEALADAAARWPARPLLDVLPETAAAYGIAAGETGYAAALARVDLLTAGYAASGYGRGHRVGLLLENRPSFLWHWLALNRLGAAIVPINPDLRAGELAYVVAHSEMCLAVAIPSRQRDLRDACPALQVIGPDGAPPPARPAMPFADDECALLYTSGTTGTPKGCVLANDYFLRAGRWYAELGGLCALRPGAERMLTPLPLFHMNALAFSTLAMMLTGGCLIVLDRFHPRTWWDSVRQSRATCLHYLGVMPAMLLRAPEDADDRAHAVRFGFGAGVERTLHDAFERRFGFPLIEAWAMTETGAGAVIAASAEPRHTGRNCFGRPAAGVEIRVAQDDGEDAPPDAPGELLVRHAGADPRAGFFRRYLKDAEGTDAAWAGGWFHTGDVVRRDGDGNCYFVDRKKNVIRRSGENISAVEVEAVLARHPQIRAVAVAAAEDALRGEEVLACIVADGALDVPALVAWCQQQMAYYKVPGWIALVDAIPLTATQKIQRGALKDMARDLLAQGVCLDLRTHKTRRA